jgi:hypothetical protein
MVWSRPSQATAQARPASNGMFILGWPLRVLCRDRSCSDTRQSVIRLSSRSPRILLAGISRTQRGRRPRHARVPTRAMKQGSYRRSNGTFTKTFRPRRPSAARAIRRTGRVVYFLRDALTTRPERRVVRLAVRRTVARRGRLALVGASDDHLSPVACGGVAGNALVGPESSSARKTLFCTARRCLAVRPSSSAISAAEGIGA